MRCSHYSYAVRRREAPAFGKDVASHFAELFIEGAPCDGLTPARFTRVAECVCEIVVERMYLMAGPITLLTPDDFARHHSRVSTMIVGVLARLANHPSARRGTWLAMMRARAKGQHLYSAIEVAACPRAMRDGVVRKELISVCNDVETVLGMMREGRKGEYRHIFRRAVYEEWIGFPRDGRWAPLFDSATTMQLAELTALDIEYALRDVGMHVRHSLLDLVARWPRPD